MKTLFPSNENTIDRAVRLVLGVALLPLAFVGPQTPWAYLALIPIVTGLVGSCPIYTLFGISTCPIKTRATQH